MTLLACATVTKVRHTNKLLCTAVMQLFALLPLLLPLSISGCLPLYHALKEGNLEAAEGSILTSPVAEGQSLPAGAHQVLSAAHRPEVKSVHFCGVCAFTKGMNGALLASRGYLLPPALASSALTVVTERALSWNPLHPVSRAPPETPAA